MTPEQRRRRLEEFKRSMSEHAERRRAEWNAGRVRLGGNGPFVGMGDPILRESYLTAARELLDKNRDHLLQVALPILFLQRHAVELALKHSVRTLVRFREVTGDGSGEAPKSLGHHNLKRLLRDFKRLLADDEKDGNALALMESLVALLHRLDRVGTWARYRDDATPVILDLGELQRDLDEAFKRLFARPRAAEDPVGWITSYEDETDALGGEEYLDGEEAA